ncbi:roadblock/LC7 domain-containing protein [Actinorugispora endophytica]|uniref:Roadblock/LAMTOR2 domain-containing protein n=1 Tax=Actinorugispora endophytica TaxID=1605990 RepID=A0A4V3D940_9ACTN|nr:roadblock/LC7 domain-containing protein [Actinorugispora endophytica]TDQ54409.1 hypothetical protein EV190_102243 [Actinorugispora endophytica]
MGTVSTPEDFVWLVGDFASEVSGVEHAVVVSADGLLLTSSRGFPVEHAEQLAAIVSGLQSLAKGAAWLFGKGESEELLLRMRRGHLVVTAIGEGSSLAVLTAPGADMKVVAYQMAVLVEGAGHALTPRLRQQLRTVPPRPVS